MKKKSNKSNEKNMVKRKPMKTLLFSLILSAFLAAITTTIYICLCYKGEFVFKGLPALVVWFIVTAIYYVAFACSHVLFESKNKNIAVMGVAILLSLGLTTFVVRYMNFFFALLTLAPLLAVLVLSKREALIVDFVISFLTLFMIYIFNHFYQDVEDYNVIYQIIIKALAGIIIIVMYKPTYNRLKVIGVGTLVSCFALIFSFAVNLFAIKIEFVDSLMDAVWMFIAETAVTVVSLLLAPIIEWVFKLETSMQFLEYISFDQPLLKELAAKAPGTFNHSIQVGNLAERCAYAIGENVNIAKAAAYFHDIGKMQSPEFFTENQAGGYNPHDDLIFETSVKIITRHTELGYQTLKNNKFPRIIADVAHEHHGDSPLSYFYIKAQNITEGDVDSSDYCYPGPKPTTRISAIIMIADSVEAASRSMGLRDRDALVRLVDKIIKDKRENGQFDECDITMKQLATIRDTLVESLVGNAHKRISYPTKKA